MTRAELHSSLSNWDGHLLLLHRSESERLSSLEAWVRRGLQRHEKVIYGEDSARAEHPFVQVLQQRGVDVATAAAEGQLTVLGPEEFYPPGGKRQMIESALAEGFPAVRLSAESRTALSVMPPETHDGFEAQMNELCRAYPVSALCQYEQAATTGTRLRRVAAAHAEGIRTAQLTTDVSDGGLAIGGEIDMSNEALLVAALRTVTAAAEDGFRLDLSGVAFLGAAGCRAVLRGTEPYRRQGGRVVLAAARPPVEHLLRIVGIDQVPGIALAARD